MNIDELFAIGNKHRELDAQSGVPFHGRDYMTHAWLVALVEYQSVNPVVAEALAHRWGFNFNSHKLKDKV